MEEFLAARKKERQSELHLRQVRERVCVRERVRVRESIDHKSRSRSSASICIGLVLVFVSMDTELRFASFILELV